jgi:hypothetical protein
MPKLSNKTLEKMFICPNCGKPFRTRQGLSGHIQFKHKVQKPPASNDIYDSIRDVQKVEIDMEVAGFTKSEIVPYRQILLSWRSIQKMCEYLKITMNNQDYKTYIISSLARMDQNEDLKKELLAEFEKRLTGLLK